MNSLKKMLSKYAGYSFQSACGETLEWKSFCTKLKNALKKEISEEYPELELVAWSKGHFYVAGFIVRTSDKAVFYFRFRDVRDQSPDGQQMYRSAKNLDDYHGGHNLWTRGENLLAAIAKAKYEFAQLEKEVERYVENGS